MSCEGHSMAQLSDHYYGDEFRFVSGFSGRTWVLLFYRSGFLFS